MAEHPLSVFEWAAASWLGIPLDSARRAAKPKCEHCGAPATCFGSYEGREPGYACDDCCGHGCEDGHCDLLTDDDD